MKPTAQFVSAFLSHLCIQTQSV